jgi:hypothetical protein
MNNFTNLFKFHISREKIHIGRKPEFESEPQIKIHQRFNTTIQVFPAIRVTKFDS